MAGLLTVGTKVFGRKRELYINGQTYSYEHKARVGPHDDAWTYTLPDGRTYSHPTEAGCLLMILKHLGGDEWST